MIEGRQEGYRVRAAVVADVGKLDPNAEANRSERILKAHLPSRG